MMLRGYQQRIANVATERNTIVLLPTGAGKTFIAAEAIINLGTPALFLVPTIPLVAQQASALRSRPNMPPIVGEYHGDKALPTRFDVLVSTPKAFETAQSRGVASLAWNKWKVIVFDEVHRCLKEHPYRQLALKLKSSGENQSRIIGLTASLTYAVGEDRIRASVNRLCRELRIEEIQFADVEELHSDGYHAAGTLNHEVRLSEEANSTSDLTVPRSDRKPHLMHAIFFDRIQTGRATPFARNLVSLIKRMEAEAREISDFDSPLSAQALKSWGEFAKKRGSAIGSPLFASLEHWYESLRLLVVSWEEAEDASIIFLRMMNCHHIPLATASWSNTTASSIEYFFSDLPTSSRRFDHLYDTLEEKLITHENFRGIIFVKQRVMTHILKHSLEQHPALSAVLNIECLYSPKSPATPSLSISKTDAARALDSFAKGESNLLISTNFAEEGIDIPAANCIIYFDHMDTAVSYVQGRGRARQENSSFVILSERTDRPADVLRQQEIEQHRLASSFIPSNTEEDAVAEENSQRQREEGAARYLIGTTENNALANLNIYCKKTKVAISESTEAGTTSNSSCRMMYQSILRRCEVTGHGNGKKAARKAAAINMLQEIATSTAQNP